MEKKAVYPGSFDPFTNGHMDIVRKASAIFDRVYIVMAVNSEKRRAFDCRRMQEAMERALADSGIRNCEVSICRPPWSRSCATTGRMSQAMSRPPSPPCWRRRM